MSRRFTEARALLGDLLDRHENGAASPIGYPDYAGFADVVAMDRFIRDLRDAERHGAVRLAMGQGRTGGEIAHVRLELSARLYTLLARRPVGELADQASGRLLDGLDLSDAFEPALVSLRKAWAQGKAWQGFAHDDVDRLRPALNMAQAILEGRHRGVDYRTFSRRTAADSKALERLEAVVVRLLSSSLELPPGARPRDALRTLGLEKFAPPMLLSGPIDFDTAELSAAAPLYFGIPPGRPVVCYFAAGRFIVSPLKTSPASTGTSWRPIRSAPESRSTSEDIHRWQRQEALRTLAGAIPVAVPLFHWSDIDPDGTWIFRTIENALERELTPHLMSVEIAERYGRSPADRVRPALGPTTSAISGLLEYLQREDAKWLEQEELDPLIPVCDGCLLRKDQRSV